MLTAISDIGFMQWKQLKKHMEVMWYFNLTIFILQILNILDKQVFRSCENIIRGYKIRFDIYSRSNIDICTLL